MRVSASARQFDRPSLTNAPELRRRQSGIPAPEHLGASRAGSGQASEVGWTRSHGEDRVRTAGRGPGGHPHPVRDSPGSWSAPTAGERRAPTAGSTLKGTSTMSDPSRQSSGLPPKPMPPPASRCRPVPSPRDRISRSPWPPASPPRPSRHRAPRRPPGRAAVQPHPRMDPLRPQRAQGRDRAEHHREDLRRRPATPRLVA